MKLKTKKKIAREILILFSCGVLLAMVYGYLILSNKITEGKKHDLEVDIKNQNSQLITMRNNPFYREVLSYKNHKKSLESLHQELFNKKIYTKSFDQFQVQFSSPKSQYNLYQALYEDGIYTKSELEFRYEYFRQPVSDSSLAAYNNIENEIAHLLDEVSILQFSLNSHKNNLLDKDDFRRILLTWFYLLLIGVYPVRIVIYLLIWSIKTLRE